MKGVRTDRGGEGIVAEGKPIAGVAADVTRRRGHPVPSDPEVIEVHVHPDDRRGVGSGPKVVREMAEAAGDVEDGLVFARDGACQRQCREVARLTEAANEIVAERGLERPA
jgi:hypothetical protein